MKRVWLVFILVCSGIFFAFAAAPAISSVILNSTSSINSTNGNLTGHVSYSDSDGDNVTLIYNWYKNDNLNRTTLLEDGLVSYYPFNDDTYDYFGVYDDTSLGQGAFINVSSGKKNGSLTIDGENDYANLGMANIDFENLTVSAWVKFYSGDVIQPIFANKEMSTLVTGIYFSASHVGAVDVKIYDKEVSIPNTAYINDNKFHMMTFTVSENGFLKLYIDGQLKDTESFADRYINVTSNNISLGQVRYAGWQDAYVLNGSIDELLVYNKSLSQEEINLLYDGFNSQNQINSSITSIGDVWKFGVKVADNSSISTEANASITIDYGTAITSINLTSTNPATNSTNQNLTGSVSFYNELGKNITEAYFWYKNDTLNRTTFIEDNLTFYYPFDNDYYDYYGAYDTPIVNNSQIDSSGIKDSCLKFSGENYSFLNTTYRIPSGTSELTANIWVNYYSDSTKIMPFIINHVATTNVSGFFLANYQTSIRAQVWNKTVETPSSPYRNGGWNMFTITFKSNESLKLYVNGEKVDEELFDNIDLPISTNNIYIGTFPLAGWGVFPLNGSVDETTVYNRQLNDSEIKRLYDGYRYSDIVPYSDTSAGDIWKVGAKALTDNEVSTQVNSSELSVNEGSTLNLEFPLEKTVIQRNESGYGELRVFGNLTGVIPSQIHMNYTGTTNGILDINVNETTGEFNETIYLYQGEYVLNFYDVDGDLGSVSEFGVGDVIIINGQSNAVASPNNDAITASPHSVYHTKYLAEYQFSDRVCNSSVGYTQEDLGVLNRWSELANAVSINQSIPVMLMNFAVGGRTIDYLKDTCLPYNYDIISERTGGTMATRGIYWYQGESDEEGNWEDYYNSLEELSSNYFGNLTFPYGEENLVVGQVLATPTTPPAGNVRLADQTAWYNINGIFKGSVMYDIKTNAEDSVHPSGEGKTIFERRNNRAMLNYLYGLFGTSPVLQNAYYYNASRLVLKFDNSNLEVSDWNETAGTIPSGIRFHSLDLTSDNITSAIISNQYVILDYSSSVLEVGANLSICDVEMDCYNETVLRTSDYLIPVEIVWNESLVEMSEEDYCEDVLNDYWYDNSCHDSAQSSISEPGDSGGSSTASPTYRPSDEKLVGGYEISLGEGFEVGFEVGGESHSLEVDEIFKDYVKVTVRSEPVIFELRVGDVRRIDLDLDGIYDLSVELRGLSVNRADLVLTRIDEKYDLGTTNCTNCTKGSEVFGGQGEEDEEGFGLWIGIIVVLVLIVLGWMGWECKSKKR